MAKVCPSCGNTVLDDNSKFCTGCGAPMDQVATVQPEPVQQPVQQPMQQPMQQQTVPTGEGYTSGLLTAAKILMIISCVASAVAIIPLAWMIPMTIKVFKREKTNEPLSTGFKVCVLLFCNVISGILLLVDDKA